MKNYLISTLLAIIFFGQTVSLSASQASTSTSATAPAHTPVLTSEIEAKNTASRSQKLERAVYNKPWTQKSRNTAGEDVERVTSEGMRIIKQCCGKEITSFLVGTQETDSKELQANWLEYAEELAPLLLMKRLDAQPHESLASKKYESECLRTIEYLQQLRPSISPDSIIPALKSAISSGYVKAVQKLVSLCKTHGISLERHSDLFNSVIAQNDINKIVPLAKILWARLREDVLQYEWNNEDCRNYEFMATTKEARELLPEKLATLPRETSIALQKELTPIMRSPFKRILPYELLTFMGPLQAKPIAQCLAAAEITVPRYLNIQDEHFSPVKALIALSLAAVATIVILDILENNVRYTNFHNHETYTAKLVKSSIDIFLPAICLLGLYMIYNYLG